MKQIILTLALMAIGLPAQAACFADYKAKQDSPLRLQYGVAEIGEPCTKASAKKQLSPKLAGDGWTLLNILGTFDETGLPERKEAAGAYFLRY